VQQRHASGHPGTPSLLRKVRASAASRFPIQCETFSLLRKVMAIRKQKNATLLSSLPMQACIGIFVTF
jgi:hypothetical protein